MAEDRFGVPRPLVEDGTGPLGLDRPLVGDDVERLIAEIESAIGDEQQADIDYHRVIMQLRELGFDDAADTVESIRNEEMRHKDEFKSILNKIRRETS